MKIFGRFETDSDSRHSLHEDSEKSIQNKEDIKEDDLRRRYLLNEPSANQTRSDHEIIVRHSKPQKQTTFMDYLRDMFKFKSKERLERDADGYVKKLYTEIDDSFPKSDETTNLMTYIEYDSEFLGSKPKQLEASGDEKEGRQNFGDKVQKLLAKVISHHGNEWFQELDDVNNESGDTKRHKIIKSISNVSLEVDEEDDSIKRIENELDGKLLAKNQWFQDLDERGDTNFEQREKQAEGFLNQLETKKPAKEEGAKFKGDGLQISEVILSYLTNLLDMKLNNPQEEVKTEKQRKNNLMVITYLSKLFGMRSEKLEDAENVQVKSEETEQVKVPQLKNEYDAKIHTYIDGLFKSKSESSVTLAKSLLFPEESGEIVTTATDFEGEAGTEVSGIAENEIISYDGDVEQETKSFDCNEENLEPDQIAPSNGLISCAMDVVKLFSRRNYPPEKEELAISRAIEEEDYVESANEEDEFEEALDQYGDEEYSLTKPINLKSLAIDVIPSHKRGSILHKIYTSGYKHILPHSIEENSLLHQCRQFLSSPNITSSNFVTEPYVNVEEDDTKDSTVNSVSENAKNEDVFEDAQDFLSEKVKEGANSYVREEVFQPGAGVKKEIRFLIRGEGCSQIIVAGKNEEEVTTVQDETIPDEADGALTTSAPEMLGLSKPGRIYDAIQDTKLDIQGSSRKELTTKDNFGEPHEICLGLDLTAQDVLNNAHLKKALEQRLGKKGVQEGALKSEIRLSPPQTKDNNQVSDVGGGMQSSTKSALVPGKNEPEVEEVATAGKIIADL